jgi:protein-S-isoprenylcysteine O-methyltransferase Ste14
MIALILALLQLNRNLSPFPTPKQNGQLVTNGLYHWMRHPIYTGILLVSYGYAIYSSSWLRLIVACVLLILFYLKSSYEEKLLSKKFSDYTAYQKRTARFFPFL